MSSCFWPWIDFQGHFKFNSYFLVETPILDSEGLWNSMLSGVVDGFFVDKNLRFIVWNLQKGWPGSNFYVKDQSHTVKIIVYFIFFM